jgi:hypothetical protein
MYVLHNTEARSRNDCCSGKAISIIYLCVRAPERVGVSFRVHVALLIQHRTRIRHILTSYVAALAAPYFSSLTHKQNDFRKKRNCKHKMCFDFFYNVCLKYFSFLEEYSEILS